MGSIISAVGGIAVGLGLFLLSFFGLNLGIIASSVFAVGGYVGGSLLFKPALKMGGIRIEGVKNSEEIQEMLDEAKKDMNIIRTVSVTAHHQPIREKANRLYHSGESIIRYLAENPSKISKTRRFFSYYLDTGADILEKYMKLARTNYKTADMENLYQSTSNAIDILNEAFDKQFTKLVENEVFDIESDIKVLEDTLKLEE